MADSIYIKCEFSIFERLSSPPPVEKESAVDEESPVERTAAPTRKFGVLIKCRDGAKKLCNRSILAAASGTLESILFTENGNSDKVDLDISEETLVILLDCLKGSKGINFHEVLPFYAAAQRFGIHELSNEIRKSLSSGVCEKFFRAQGILDKVSVSDLPHISHLIERLDISTFDKALFCRALIEWKSKDGQRDALIFDSISRILTTGCAMFERAPPPTDCYLRADSGKLVRVTGAPNSSSLGLSDDPRWIPDDIDGEFVIKGDFCISILEGDLEVRPLKMAHGEADQRKRLFLDDLLGIDCSATQIFAWSQHSVFSVTIENGRPVKTLLKVFESGIKRVFAFEYKSSAGLAVLEPETGVLKFYDSAMNNCGHIVNMGEPEAISTEYLLTSSDERLELYSISLSGRATCMGSPDWAAGTEVDYVIRGSTMYVLSTVAAGTRLTKLDGFGSIEREIILEGIKPRFVKVVR